MSLSNCPIDAATSEQSMAILQAQTLSNKLVALFTCVQMHALSQSFPPEAQRELAELITKSSTAKQSNVMAILSRKHGTLSLSPFDHLVSADIWLMLTYHELLKVSIMLKLGT